MLSIVNSEPAPESDSRPRSHLFTVRVWLEDLGSGQFEWRGKVQDVGSGEAKYFREWSMLLVFLLETLSQYESNVDSTQRGNDANP